MILRPRYLFAPILVALASAIATAQTPPVAEAAVAGDVLSGIPADSDVYEETVVVTASRTAEHLLDVPVSVTVIREEEIARSPASNFADLLRGVPGLNVVQLSARDINVTPRGATGVFSQGLLALVDGKSIVEPNNGILAWDRLSVDFDEISQVEVLHGPGSAVWGPNALSGVINIRTKTPRELQGGRVVVGGGELGTRNASLRWADAFEKFSYKISGSFLEQDAWERSPSLPDGTPLPAALAFDGVGTRQPRADVRVDYEPDIGRRWTFGAGYAQMHGLIFTNGLPIIFRPSTYSATADVGYSGRKLDAKVYWTRNNAKTTNAVDGSYVNSDNDVFTAEATGRLPVGQRQFLVFGGSATRVLYDIDVVPETSRSEAGAFFEDQVALGKKVVMGAGVRFDHFDTLDLAVSPRLSFVVRPNDDHALRFSYSRAFRPPTPVENHLEITSASAVDIGLADPFAYSFVIYGDENLSEQQSEGIEVGWTGVFAQRHEAGVALYHNVVKDFVELFPESFYSPADPPPGWPLDPSEVPAGLLKSLRYGNIGRVTDQGIELSLRSRWTRALTTTFSWTIQDDPKIEGAPGLTNLPPKHQASFLLGVERGPFRGSFGVTWTDRAFWSDTAGLAGYTDDYLLVNGAFAWAFGPERRLELALAVTNLLDDSIQQHIWGDVIRRHASLELRAKF